MQNNTHRCSLRPLPHSHARALKWYYAPFFPKTQNCFLCIYVLQNSTKKLLECNLRTGMPLCNLYILNLARRLPCLALSVDRQNQGLGYLIPVPVATSWNGPGDGTGKPEIKNLSQLTLFMLDNMTDPISILVRFWGLKFDHFYNFLGLKI